MSCFSKRSVVQQQNTSEPARRVNPGAPAVCAYAVRSGPSSVDDKRLSEKTGWDTISCG